MARFADNVPESQPRPYTDHYGVLFDGRKKYDAPGKSGPGQGGSDQAVSDSAGSCAQSADNQGSGSRRIAAGDYYRNAQERLPLWGLAFAFGGSEPTTNTTASTDTVLTDLTVEENSVAEKTVAEKTVAENAVAEKPEKTTEKKEKLKAESASVKEKPVTGPIPKTEEGLAAAEKYTSVFTPISLYFPLNEANYINTGETKKFFKEASGYLRKHKNRKLLVTGYTDNAGPSDVNQRLSRERANSVKQKLRKSGIRTDQITVVAKGEKDPKYSNDTREGRKANRRVSVVVQ
ncbi:OmpA family protein [Spirosoma sp. KUDC1026]|nr:OmpA family protein [Spirosoma sp. KUDC1026]